MTQGQVIAPFLERLEQLEQMINESPYLPAETRKELEGEILKLQEKLRDGNMTSSNGEKSLSDLNKKTVLQEIESLIKKIGNLNPSSPRLETLRDLSARLNHGEISPEQARQGIFKLMKG